jgi:tetratricopeptide (TPR) repeat protein
MLLPPLLLALAMPACEENLRQAAAALQQKNATEARVVLDNTRSECAESASFFELDAVTYALSNKLPEAEAAFRKALRLSPQSARLLVESGVLLLKDNQIVEGTGNLEKALQIEPGNEAAVGYLASAYAAERKAGDLMRLIDKHPLPATVLFSLALQLAKQEQYRSAADCLEKIPAANADDAVYFNKGLAYSHMKEWTKARESYFRAIDLHTGHVDAYFHVGLDYASSGEPRKAVPWLLRAHELDPERSDVDYVLCEQLIELKYFESAAQILQDALARNAQQPLLQAAQGDLALRKGDNAGARAAYNEALQQQPALVPAIVGLARCDQAEGNNEAAMARLREASRSHPEDPTINGQLGALEMHDGNWAAASEHLQRAWAVDQSNANVALEWARVLRHTGKPSEAIHVLKTIAPALEDTTDLHLELAQNYAALHRPLDAEAERKLVSRLQPGANTTLRFEDPQTYVH